ncbi:hypothetical protein JCM8097_001285 [Rhodosporidiobolus ruineniae]
MNDQALPGYSADPAPSTLLNLAPPAETATFQLGHLGYGPAFVAGDVQVKYAGSDTDPKPAFSRLEIAFRGVEKSRAGDEGIELCEQRKVLWGVGAAGSSSSASTDDGFPPGSTPFKLELTPDLPTCLHLGSSSLEYTLTASLFYLDPTIPPLVRCSPVHLARTSPPGPLRVDPPFSTSPQTISASSPLSFSVRLSRTAFRRSEPIELVVRLDVPDVKALGAGLRLRTVSAELARTIKVVGEGEGSSMPRAEGGEDGSGVVLGQQEHRTILAHSGKSARFSPTRPVVIKLVLHPPPVLSCESVTQSTILHSVTFSVLVTIGLFHPSSSSSSSTTAIPLRDPTLSQEVLILPDLTPSSSAKQKEAARDAFEAVSSTFDGPVPRYVEDSQLDAGEAPVPSGSGSSALTAAEEEQLRHNFSSTSSSPVLLTFGEEIEEYDGYEELSLPSSLLDRAPPPPIDDDVSPPSAGDNANSLLLELAAAQGIPLDTLDEVDRRGGSAEGEEEEELQPYSPRASPPPPSFDSHARAHGGQNDLAVPATPPPHVDFPPFPSLGEAGLPSTPPPSLPPPHSPPSSPPPPASPLDAHFPPLPSSPTSTHAHSRAPSESQSHPHQHSRYPHPPLASPESLPPPYFNPPPLPPPVELEHSHRSRSVSPARMVLNEHSPVATNEPPPYESRDAPQYGAPPSPPLAGGDGEGERVELVRFGVNRRGEVVM